jgi:hypothetical protein
VPWIIDGDNLLGTWPGRRRSDRERRALAAELFRFAVRERRRAVVVFDGPAPPVPPPSPDVRFSGPGRSADSVIVEFLREQKDPRGWTVVSSDRALGDQCRWLGARVVRSDRFRGRLAHGDGREKPEGPVDVSEWSEYFGLSDDDLDGDPG